MTARIFTADQVNQGSAEWWELRRGIPTSSGFDRILTAKQMKPSAQQKGYAAELAADVANQDPHWFTERSNRPPNKAVADGIAREAESRDRLRFDSGWAIQQIGFALHENGLWGCSPDGLLISPDGELAGTLELKNPQLDTQAMYLLDGDLPSEYRAQCQGHIIVTDAPMCLFFSYHPDLDPLPVEVYPDEFGAALHDALESFTAMYLGVLDKLKLRNRFEDQRASILAHFPDSHEGVSHAANPEPVPTVQGPP